MSLTIKNENTELSINGVWGGVETLDAGDVNTPRLFLGQALSPFVGEQLAKVGQWYDSFEEQAHDSLDVILFDVQKLWHIEVKEGNKNKVIRKEPITPRDNKRPYETADGEFNIRAWEYSLLLVNKDGTLSDVPYLLILKKTWGSPAARAINIAALKAAQKGKPLASIVFNLTGSKTKGDKGNFAAAVATPVREATKEQLAKAFEWYQMGHGAPVVQEEEDAEALTLK